MPRAPCTIACTIEWNALRVDEWETQFARIRRAPLLQSYDYARAVCPLNRQRARWGVIHIDGATAGLVQILEAGLLGNLIHGVMLDRGPLWLPGYGDPAHSAAFFAAFHKEAPRRPCRRRRIIPELPDNEHTRALMLQAGYRRLDRPGYQTRWLDLAKTGDDLRAGLRKKWRNSLSKAERAGLALDWDTRGAHLGWLLARHSADKAQKNYDGPSATLIRRLAVTFAQKGRLLIGRAMLDKNAVAAILILCHGTAATYQVGWSSDDGRRTAAHNLLLWQALCRLKNDGYTDFDLGGSNEDTARGIKTFKDGMGGQAVTLAGHYI